VIFELPTRRLAEGLLGQLSPKRFAWIQNDEDAAVVAALLNPDHLDLARVQLRSAVAIRPDLGAIYAKDPLFADLRRLDPGFLKSSAPPEKADAPRP